MVRILILGGSFAGLTAALELKRKLPSAHVILASRTDRFWFIPSLIWVPFGRRTSAQMSFPLAPVLKKAGVEFRLDEATRIHPDRGEVKFAKSGTMRYDKLLIATGPAYDYGIVPGLKEHAYGPWNITEAERMGAAWKEFLKDPGPIIVGGTQKASCFGAGYELLFNIEHQLRKAGIRKKVALTYVTAEPFPSHFGIGGMAGGKTLVGGFFKMRHIACITNASMSRVEKDKVVLGDGRELPCRFAVIVPPFIGAEVVRASGLGNDRGFIPVDDSYRHKDWPDIYAAGIAAAVPPPPGKTAVPVGVPKTGFMSEVMARVAVDNILRSLAGKKPRPKPFTAITPLCVMDAGDMEVWIAGSKMYPRRGLSVMIPNPFGDWAKRLFEKYYLWKMRTGRAWLP